MLQIGDRAPGFVLESEDGGIGLGDYEGKWLVLYFYPRDNTPGCTIEARDFTCLEEEFAALAVAVLGVSRDSVASHGKFRAKQDLSIRLGSDPEHKCMEAYGAWREKKLYGKIGMGVIRSTFLIAPDGTIAAVWESVRAKGHAEEVLNLCREKCGGKS